MEIFNKNGLPYPIRVFPGKQGIYLENGIRPPFLYYKLGKFFLQVS